MTVEKNSKYFNIENKNYVIYCTENYVRVLGFYLHRKSERVYIYI